MSGTYKANVTTSEERKRLLAEWGRHTWHRFAVLDWDWAENLGIMEECRGWSREQIEEWRKELHMATYTPEQGSEDFSLRAGLSDALDIVSKLPTQDLVKLLSYLTGIVNRRLYG